MHSWVHRRLSQRQSHGPDGVISLPRVFGRFIPGEIQLFLKHLVGLQKRSVKSSTLIMRTLEYVPSQKWLFHFQLWNCGGTQKTLRLMLECKGLALSTIPSHYPGVSTRNRCRTFLAPTPADTFIVNTVKKMINIKFSKSFMFELRNGFKYKNCQRYIKLSFFLRWYVRFVKH